MARLSPKRSRPSISATKLDLPVAGVGEHRVGIVIGAWTELPNAAVASEELLDGRSGSYPFPVTPHGIIAPAARSICELD